MRDTRASAVRAVAWIVLPFVLVVAGCGTTPDGSSTDGSNTDKESTVDTSDRPAMEEVLDGYELMLEEMFEALDSELGKKPWDKAPNNAGRVRSGCGEDEDDEGEKVSLDLYAFLGTYDRDDWQRAAEIVWEVGQRHGFDDTGTVVDRADDLEVYGQDEYGGRYVFAMATNTVMSISTGCHRWSSQPPDAPSPSGPPETED